MEDEPAAFVGLRLDRNASAMGFHDRFDEAQTEAEPPLGAALVAAVEALPDAWGLVRGNADACVAQAEKRLAVRRAGRDFDLPASRRVFQRVVEQVGDDLSHPRPIDIDPELVGRLVFESDAFLLCYIFVELHS